MKKLILITTFLSSLVFSSVCFAEWTLVSTHVDGHRFYIDLDRIQIKDKGSVLYWNLTDFAKRIQGNLSAKVFLEADCSIPRKVRVLIFSHYTQPMAQGDPSNTMNKPTEWRYPPPGSSMERDLDKVCPFAKKKLK